MEILISTSKIGAWEIDKYFRSFTIAMNQKSLVRAMVGDITGYILLWVAFCLVIVLNDILSFWLIFIERVERVQKYRSKQKNMLKPKHTIWKPINPPNSNRWKIINVIQNSKFKVVDSVRMLVCIFSKYWHHHYFLNL